MNTLVLTIKLFRHGVWLLLLSANIVLLKAVELPKTSPRTSIADAEIREVVARVARHQVHLLADGDYPAVTTLEAAQAARPPRGILWNYPWGVTLSGLLRVAEVTGGN
jgi:hypothetical protein